MVLLVCFFLYRISVAGNNADHSKEDRRGLLILDLKIYRISVSGKTQGGIEFYRLDALDAKLRSIQVILDVQV